MEVSVFLFGEMIAVLVLRVVGVGVDLLLSFTVLERWRETRIRALLLLAIFSFASSAAGIISSWRISLRLLAPWQFGGVSFSSTLALSALGLAASGFFLLFIDYFENERVTAWRLALFTGVLAAYLSWAYIILLRGVEEGEVVVGLGEAVPLMMVPLFLLCVCFLCYRALERCKAFAYGEEHRRQLTLMQLSLFTFFFIIPLLGMRQNMLALRVGITEEVVQLLNCGVEAAMIAGVLLLWRAYAMSPRAAFLQPQRVYRLLAINEAGVPLFSYFFSKAGEQIDAALISGGISAVASLVGEAVGTSSPIRSIRLEEMELMVRHFGGFTLLLFTERASRFLSQAMDNFGRAFSSTYGHLVEKARAGPVDQRDFEGAVPLLERAFGLRGAD